MNELFPLFKHFVAWFAEWPDIYVHWNAEGFTKWWLPGNYSWPWNVSCHFAACCKFFFFFFLRHTCTWNYVLQVLLSGLLSITSTILLLPVELLWVLKHLLIFKSWTQVNTTQSNRKFTTIKKFWTMLRMVMVI